MPLLKAGLVGAHISNSLFPAALQILCDAKGWSLSFQLIDTALKSKFDLKARMLHATLDGWSGLSVTHPWKVAARHSLVDHMVPGLEHLGATNLVRMNGSVTGFNTDYTGFLAAFAALKRAPGKVVMMGAGGVAEALAPALMDLGCSQLLIHDRDPSRATALAAKCDAHPLAADDVADAVVEADGLVNASPMGTQQHPGSAFHPTWLGPQKWAFDAVYTPTRTWFVQSAEIVGLSCLTGFDLFKTMAVESFRAYTEETVDFSRVAPALEALRPD